MAPGDHQAIHTANHNVVLRGAADSRNGNCELVSRAREWALLSDQTRSALLLAC